MNAALWVVDLCRAFWHRNDPDPTPSFLWDDGTAEYVARTSN